MNRKKWSALFVFAAAVSLASALGGFFTNLSLSGWYFFLRKPSWTPPEAVFAPVWTALFALMALAGWLVWRRLSGEDADGRVEDPTRRSNLSIYLFAIQLVVNVFWSATFFGLRSPGAAFFVILLLLALVLWTTVSFWRVSEIAGFLLVPYLAWLIYAAALNFDIWRLNR